MVPKKQTHLALSKSQSKSLAFSIIFCYEGFVMGCTGFTEIYLSVLNLDVLLITPPSFKYGSNIISCWTLPKGDLSGMSCFVFI